MNTSRERLQRILQRLRAKQRAITPFDSRLTPEWARQVDDRLDRVERQLKFLNGSLIAALLADIALRLLGLHQ